eukprot:2105064-Prorocentrum_lima.AAC.1
MRSSLFLLLACRPSLQIPLLLCRASPSDAGMANRTGVSSSHTVPLTVPAAGDAFRTFAAHGAC